MKIWKILAALTLIWLQLGQCVDYQTTKSLMEDFYSTVEQPVNRLQNLFRANFAPTLWCGIRNSAPFPDALSAIYPHLDSCCRIHDLCPLFIRRGNKQECTRCPNKFWTSKFTKGQKTRESLFTL